MYNVKVDNQEFTFTEENGVLFFDSKPLALDIHKIDNKQYHLLYHNQSLQVEVLELNRPEKTLQLKINSKVHQVIITDQYDLLLRKLGFDKLLSSQVSELKAPMPGLVLKVSVSEGDTVQKGDNLLILEAMKMENIIKSPVEGIIKSISVKEGDKVDKNQTLISF